VSGQQNTEYNPIYLTINSSKTWWRAGNVGVSLCLPGNRTKANLLAVLALINDNIKNMLQSGTAINLRLET
jgi:hypothetical protein